RFDRDAIALDFRLHVDLVDGLLVLPALLHLDEHFGAAPGTHLHRPVEGRQPDLGRLSGGEPLLFPLDERLSIHLDGAAGDRRRQHGHGEGKPKGSSHDRVDVYGMGHCSEKTMTPSTHVCLRRRFASRTARSAFAPSAITPRPCRPSSRAGVVAHIVAASGSDTPMPASRANARSIVSTLPASVPSSSVAVSPTVIG